MATEPVPARLLTVAARHWANLSKVPKSMAASICMLAAGGSCSRLHQQVWQAGSLWLRNLKMALGALPPVQLETVLLVGLEGMSYREVASITGVSLGTVMTRLRRGRDRLALLVSGDSLPRRAN
jgi:RNA polymerase sigma-70 factor (ECF subfamily)